MYTLIEMNNITDLFTITKRMQETTRKERQKASRRKRRISSQQQQVQSWNKKGSHPPCQHCGGKSHPHFKCLIRPYAKCNKCNMMGHEAIIGKTKINNMTKMHRLLIKARIHCSWLHVSLASNQVRVGLLTVVDQPHDT